MKKIIVLSLATADTHANVALVAEGTNGKQKVYALN